MAILNAAIGRGPRKRPKPKIAVSDSASTLNQAAHHDSSREGPALPLSLFSFYDATILSSDQASLSGVSTSTPTMEALGTHSSTETVVDSTPATWYWRCCACASHAGEVKPSRQMVSLPAWFSSLEVWQRSLSLTKYLADEKKSVKCWMCLHPICRYCALSTTRT